VAGKSAFLGGNRLFPDRITTSPCLEAEPRHREFFTVVLFFGASACQERFCQIPVAGPVHSGGVSMLASVCVLRLIERFVIAGFFVCSFSCWKGADLCRVSGSVFCFVLFRQNTGCFLRGSAALTSFVLARGNGFFEQTLRL